MRKEKGKRREEDEKIKDDFRQIKKKR